MDVLKDILEDLYTPEIKEKVGSRKLILLDEGKFIPVEKFNQKLEEIKQQKEVIDDYKKQLQDLEKKAKGHDELEQTIKELKAENEKKEIDYQTKIAEQKKDFAVQAAIKEAQGKNVKAIKALLDIEKIIVDDNGIVGLSDQLKTIKESDAYLFGEDKIVGPDDKDKYDKKGNPKPDDFDTQIKEAEEKGDILTAISLKRQRYEAAQKKQE